MSMLLPIHSTANQRPGQDGFSLVELAVVIVIVGLVLGGALAGRHLLKSSEIKALGDQVVELNNSIGMFKDKYGYLPGDMPNATSVWGAADGGDGLGADCWGVNSAGSMTTCNGNGDGQIQQNSADTFKYETWRLWQQLANAGMIAGQYTGVAQTPSTTDREANPGVNVPAAKIESVGFTMLYKPSSVWVDWYTNNFEKNVITIGKRGDRETRNPFLTAAEMRSLDEKMDDGKPGTGKIQTWLPSLLPNCASSATAASAVYLSTSEDVANACAFYYVTNL